MAPIFDYECEACKAIFEKFVRKHDDEVKCAICDRVCSKQIPAVAGFRVPGGYDSTLQIKDRSTKDE